MKHFARDFVRGLALALPVVVAAGMCVREFLKLKEASAEIDTQRIEALAARDAAENKLAQMQHNSQGALEARLKEAGLAAQSQGAAEERLQRLIDFLQKEVATSEAAIKDLETKRGGKQRVSQLLAEISRLNREIEDLREDRDRWKRASEKP
ncbi:MAG: hypothetical protein ACR2OZ_04045 [Verrucomicrobiales bacterium]